MRKKIKELLPDNVLSNSNFNILCSLGIMSLGEGKLNAINVVTENEYGLLDSTAGYDESILYLIMENNNVDVKGFAAGWDSSFTMRVFPGPQSYYPLSVVYKIRESGDYEEFKRIVEEYDITDFFKTNAGVSLYHNFNDAERELTINSDSEVTEFGLVDNYYYEYSDDQYVLDKVTILAGEHLTKLTSWDDNYDQVCGIFNGLTVTEIDIQCNLPMLETMESAFKDIIDVVTINMSNVDTTGITNWGSAFKDTKTLVNFYGLIDTRDGNANKVDMFTGCDDLVLPDAATVTALTSGSGSLYKNYL